MWKLPSIWKLSGWTSKHTNCPTTLFVTRTRNAKSMNLFTNKLMALLPSKFKWIFKFKFKKNEESSSLQSLSRPHETPPHLVIWADIAAPLGTDPAGAIQRGKGANGPAWVIILEYNAFNQKPWWSHWVNKPQPCIPLLGKKNPSSHTGK